MMKNNFPWKVECGTQSDKKFILNVVLAEFDIATGSTVRHQYPKSLNLCKDDWLAENMLPEGAHNRQIDCSYLILNRYTNNIAPDTSAYDFTSISKPIHNPNNDIIFGMNLCKTRYDSNVRRGAIVKAMAVFTNFHYLEIFKKPLDYALEQYFDNPVIDVLKGLYESLNKINYQLWPSPSKIEKLLMCRNSEFTYDTINQAILKYCPLSWSYEFDVFLHISIPSPVTIETINKDKEQTTTTLTSSENIAADRSTDTMAETMIELNTTTTTTATSTTNMKTIENCISFPLHIPLYLYLDHIGNSHLLYFIHIFGESTMTIYNSILAKKRILFVGYNHAVSDISKMVLTAVSLVGSLIPDIIYRIYPYANLTDLSFIQTPGYIAGVTNPMFVQNETWWDVVCILDLAHESSTVRISSYQTDKQEKKILGGKVSTFGGNRQQNNNNNNGLPPLVQRSTSNTSLYDTNTEKSSHYFYSTNSQNSSTNTSTHNNKPINTLSTTNASTTAIQSYNIFDEDHIYHTMDQKFIQSIQAVINSNQHLSEHIIENWIRIRFRDYTLRLIDYVYLYKQHVEYEIQEDINSRINEIVVVKRVKETDNNNEDRNSQDIKSSSKPSKLSQESKKSSNKNLKKESSKRSVQVSTKQKKTNSNNNNSTTTNNNNMYIDIDRLNEACKRYYNRNLSRLVILSEIPELLDAYDKYWSDDYIFGNTGNVSSDIPHVVTSQQDAIQKLQSDLDSDDDDDVDNVEISVDKKKDIKNSDEADKNTHENTVDGEDISNIDNDDKSQLSEATNITENTVVSSTVNIQESQTTPHNDTGSATQSISSNANVITNIKEKKVSNTTSVLPNIINVSIIRLLRSCILKLQCYEDLSHDELEDILNQIKSCLVLEQYVQILILSLPESCGGIHIITSGLFSSHPHIRFLVMNILMNIEVYESTKHILLSMNNIYKIAYQRNLQKIQDGSLFLECEKYQVYKEYGSRKSLTPNIKENTTDAFINKITTNMNLDDQMKLSITNNIHNINDMLKNTMNVLDPYA